MNLFHNFIFNVNVFLRCRKNVYENRREESQLIIRQGNFPLKEIQLYNIQAGLRREDAHGYRTDSPITPPDGVQDYQVPPDGVQDYKVPPEGVQDYQDPVYGTEYNQVPYDSTTSGSEEELQVSKENVAAKYIQVPKEIILAEVTQDRTVFKQSTPAEEPDEKIEAKVEKDQHVHRNNILAGAAEDYPAYKEKRPGITFDYNDRASKNSTTNNHNDSGYSSNS